MSTFTKYLIVFIVSMVPIIELRGSIPIAAGMGLDPITALIVAIVGNMVPVPFIYFFASKILNWGKDKKIIGGFCTWLINKGDRAGKKLAGKRGIGLFIGLMLFVGIPLPGTGAWTGTFAASILNVGMKKTSLAVICGVLLAGLIMLLVSLGVVTGLDFLIS